MGHAHSIQFEVSRLDGTISSLSSYPPMNLASMTYTRCKTNSVLVIHVSHHMIASPKSCLRLLKYKLMGICNGPRKVSGPSSPVPSDSTGLRAPENTSI